MEVQVPSGDQNPPPRVGPFFATRPRALDESLDTGLQQGFWLTVDSTGSVELRRLGKEESNPVLASSKPPAMFEDEAFHRLDVQVHAKTLQVWLDGAAVRFNGMAEGQALELRDVQAGAAGIVFQAAERPLFSLPQRARSVTATAGPPGSNLRCAAEDGRVDGIPASNAMQ